jgi:AcrR family transcriptional regulator
MPNRGSITISRMANAAGRVTRERLLLTAERLFAERGIDAVPLREIGAAAGQRNVAAANYYFGDRDGLVRAIFEYRLTQVNARHQEMLDAALVTTPAQSEQRVRSLLQAFTQPIWEQSGAGHFLGFIARLQTDFGRGDQFIADEWMNATNEIFALCRVEYPHHTDAIFEQRIAAVHLLTVHLLATRQHFDLGIGIKDDEEWLADVIEVQMGILGAPSATPTGRTARQRRPRDRVGA